MKLIEGLKKIKTLQKKAEELVGLVRLHSAIASIETETYPNQTKQVSEWVQAHSDIIKEVLRLRTAIQRTNLATEVMVELDGKAVKKSIAEWIHRRRDLAKLEFQMWNSLTDRNIKEGVGTGPAGDKMEIRIRRFYDPVERDKKRDLYGNEPMEIDAKLEIANATTDLIEEV